MASFHRTDLLLLTGMVLGIALAAGGLVGDVDVPEHEPAVDAVAVLDGRPLPRSRFENAVGLLERDRGRPATKEERHRVLGRLVDEELLLRRGLELGLVESDRRLRGDLVAAVVDALTAEAEAVEPDPATLADFHARNLAMFSPPPPLRVAQVFVAKAARGETGARERAAEAARRLRVAIDEAAAGSADLGTSLAEVRAALGDPPARELPDVLLPPAKLRDYVGDAAASAALEAGEGDVTDPVPGDDGYRVLLVLERSVPAATDLDAVRDRVLAEYRRRAAEEALELALVELRSTASITLLEDAEAMDAPASAAMEAPAPSHPGATSGR